MTWKPRGEWQAVMTSTAISPTLRPCVPTWTARVMRLPPQEVLEPELRRSSLAWKEVQVVPSREAVRNRPEE